MISHLILNDEVDILFIISNHLLNTNIEILKENQMTFIFN